MADSTVVLTVQEWNVLLTEAQYALRQAQRFRDCDRAGDALERLVERLEAMEPVLDVTEWTAEEVLAREG